MLQCAGQEPHLQEPSCSTSTSPSAATTSMSGSQQAGAWPGLPAARPCPSPLSLGSWPPPWTTCPWDSAAPPCAAEMSNISFQIKYSSSCGELCKGEESQFLWLIKPEYCDYTLSMFILWLRNIMYDTTGGQSALLRSAGQLGKKLLVSRRMRSIVTSARTGSIHHENENLWETLGLSWWMDPLGSSLECSWSPLGFPSDFDLWKSLGGPSIFSLGTPLSTLGKLPRGSIHHDIPSGFSQIVPCSHGVSGPFWITRYINIRPTSTIHHFKWLFQDQL